MMGEPVHGSAPDIMGKGKANPIAAIRSAGLLLEHLGYRDEAHRLNLAVNSALSKGICTADLGGESSTAQVTDAIIQELE